ncbi:MAG TPA: hypothetical protein VG758_28800 [Hyphomicrobiaceae bacterium]|jgi:hypothetical protein|nr:hypothetical protein [Hyphomicrobiaceae bacterium]
MANFAVFRLRLHPDIKRCLKDAARAEKTSIGRPLDRIAREWLDRREAEDEAEQRRLHAEFLNVVGTISSVDATEVALGKGPYTRQRIREHTPARLAEKRKRRPGPERRGR